MTIEKLNEIAVSMIANTNTWPPAMENKKCEESVLAYINGIMDLRCEIENEIKNEVTDHAQSIQ